MGRGGLNDEGYGEESEGRFEDAYEDTRPSKYQAAGWDLDAIFSEHITGDDTPEVALKSLLGYLGSLPESFSERVGEPLQVYSSKVEATPDSLWWRYQIVGEKSGQELTELNFTITQEGLNDVPLEAIGMGLRAALHAPGELGEDFWRSFSALTGTRPFSCDYCSERFETSSEAVSHEREAHQMS